MRLNIDEEELKMQKLSLVTGLVCLTGLTSYAQKTNHDVPQINKVVNTIELCSNDGKIIAKRYIAKYKGKKYLACCKVCANEIIDRLEKIS